MARLVRCLNFQCKLSGNLSTPSWFRTYLTLRRLPLGKGPMGNSNVYVNSETRGRLSVRPMSVPEAIPYVWSHGRTECPLVSPGLRGPWISSSVKRVPSRRFTTPPSLGPLSLFRFILGGVTPSRVLCLTGIFLGRCQYGDQR